uniref:Quinolinate synthaseic n=1 Tax=Rhizophora mucronata TaxID=61149 RepID=A0A2P2LBC5_RHIMU
MNVRPVFLCSSQDALNFRVHIKVSNNTNLLLLQFTDKFLNLRFIREQVSCLSLSVGALGMNPIGGNNQRRKRLQRHLPFPLRHQLLGPLLHTQQHVMPRVHPRPLGAGQPHVERRQILRLHPQNLLRRSPVEHPNQARCEPAGDLRVAIRQKSHLSALVQPGIEPDAGGAAHDAVGVDPGRLRERRKKRGAVNKPLNAVNSLR